LLYKQVGSSDSDDWTKAPLAAHNRSQMRDRSNPAARRRGGKVDPESAAGPSARASRLLLPESDHYDDFDSRPEAFADELDRTLHLRRISTGKSMLDRAEASLARLDPADPHAARVLLLVAQWVDVGYRDHRLLDFLLLRFPADCRKRLSIADYLRLRMVDAFRALSVEDVDSAVDSLDFVLKTETDLPDEGLAALAHFWKGRAHRKKGEYETALLHIVRARELAQKSNDEIFTAIIQIQESWLLFQKGMRKEALRLLSHAESILEATDHYVALGNIESARGRIVRRSGEYTQALEHFDRAIALYAQGDLNHPNLARALVNAAYVRRLLSLQLRRKIDARAQPGGAGTSAGAGSGLRARYQQISHQAILDLRRAREIYALHVHAGGTGNVLFNLGYLHLDRGDIDHAAHEAGEAYRLGLEKNDHILMARARILQAAAENARVEEQLGEDVDIAVYANLALQHSEEALGLARGTQNRRLLAGAWIARGATAANDFFQDWELARRSASEAASLMGPGETDHLVDALTALKSQIVRASGISDTLRAWSEGMVGDKTFQQIAEEFAEIVIPKVWIREDRKISRVAESLSISPKKVRRILRNAGYLERG
jgi:tetratricopeptide (TPR) repeat protein